MSSTLQHLEFQSPSRRPTRNEPGPARSLEAASRGGRRGQGRGRDRGGGGERSGTKAWAGAGAQAHPRSIQTLDRREAPKFSEIYCNRRNTAIFLTPSPRRGSPEAPRAAGIPRHATQAPHGQPSNAQHRTANPRTPRDRRQRQSPQPKAQTPRNAQPQKPLSEQPPARARRHPSDQTQPQITNHPPLK